MSTLTPDPSPSPNPQPDNSNTWAFPGPSSRFHTRERIRPRREVKSTYTPIAPNLSTAQRAQHKRAQSAQVVPLAKRSQGESAGPPSPPASESARRSPYLARYSSWTGGESPSLRRRRTSLAMSSAGGMMTPARGSGGEWDKRLQDSPFSDYFTDDARSVDTSAGKSSRYSGAGAWLSEEGQDLLARLGRLQTRVMRAEEGEQEWVRRVVERKVREVERELEDWDRRPGSAELEDSGFIDEEGEEAGGASEGVEGLGLHGVSECPEREEVEQEDASSQEVDSESDLQLSEARQILENVTKAQEELRQRHTELRLLTDQHLEQLENNETEIETLRSENEGLRSDLGFDHSELLFLKLQMKAIEVEVEDLDKPASQSQKLANHSQHGEKNVRRGQILQEMDQWRNDWQDVNGRLKRRLSRYGVLSADKRDHSLEKELQVRAEDLGDWQLETIRERSGGKVASLTIRRVKHGEPVADGVVEIQARMGKAEEEEEGQMPTHAEQKSSPPAGASEKGCQTEDQHNTNYVEQGSQTDRIPPVPTIDQVIQTEALNHSDISTSTDLSTSLSSSNPVQSYHDEATQTDVSLASLLPPRYYAPDAYGIEQSGEAVTELVLVDGEKEEMDDEEEDEDDEEEEEEDEADPAISTFPSSPTNTHDINDDNDEASSPPTHPSASFEEEIASSSLKQQQQQQQQQQRRKYKSAWAELWEGLGHLAGVGGDEDDEEGEEEEEGY
ncbi:hypothetical protein KC332_g16601 [Hortaea werneckii]|uniref:Uncharacterized protein n=1 Tax=Hortaea werneckii TaxID=91943 RepID=A0A3M7JAG1_HORWE|nr:hypothetical protein KC350_g9858 [Hortaea werneckii]KAI6833560.1 hypothetical protein KC358_g6066 [Hortaea werneckii]KAI6913322.1 hypothetical protein KC348_g12468 [Hortaea werneckii]KAI6936978.1 hypothetical protein KC341_g5879 [Hortaea werneckii]KAI6971721.1 hypothetical protein KC321_g6626 [Hortaea werneckii]